MSEGPRWLAGNTLGGLLQAMLGAEMTGTPHMPVVRYGAPWRRTPRLARRRIGPLLPGLRPDQSRRGSATRLPCRAPHWGVGVDVIGVVKYVGEHEAHEQAA
jgi:hypothetical protein